MNDIWLAEEMHENLYGGNGLVRTFTRKLKKHLLFGDYWTSQKFFTKMILEGESKIGRHRNGKREVYLTLNHSIRFNNKQRYRAIFFCPRSQVRSIQNVGNDEAIVYAIKF